jgi:hypothetical protein
MEVFRANKFDGKTLEMSSSDDIKKLYAVLEKEENFILEWTEKTNNGKSSRLMIGTELFPKVKTGEIILTAVGWGV